MSVIVTGMDMYESCLQCTKPDYTLKNYTEEEYKEDMTALLKEKGLKGAVSVYLDKIDEELAGTSYLMHRSVQEWLEDVLYLIDLDKEIKDGDNNGNN